MDHSIKEIQDKQLEILHELDRVCKACGITYYLAAGTCLGAVRHGGFIPLDDDVDVFMKWDDVERLENNTDKFGSGYFLQSPDSDPGVNTTHYRLRDSNTTCIMKDDQGRDMNHGMFIDIYVLYPCPDSFFKMQKVIYDSFVYRILQAGDGPQNHGKIANLIGRAVCKIYNDPEKRRGKIKKVQDEYKHSNGKKAYVIYFGEDIKLFWVRKYPQKWFEKPAYIKFEDLTAPCPTDPDEYCRFRYGDDYMELPPAEKRVTNHDFVYLDLNSPYKQSH